jgi:hypothetical protein
VSQGDGAGRPPLFDSADELQLKIDGYFSGWINLEKDDPKLKEAPNIWGICLYAGMSYDAFADYENGLHDERDSEFSGTIKNAKLRLLDFNAKHVLTHTAGVVFNTVNLTRKMKEPWRNAQTNEHSGPDGGPIELKGIASLLSDAHKDANG